MKKLAPTTGKISIAIVGLYLFISSPAYAQCANPGPFGCIDNPLPYGSGPGQGLIILLNNVLRLIFIIAGIYAFIQVILAGTSFINAGGDSKKIIAAWYKIWQSLLGLAIIVSSVVLAALMGHILFGDFRAILNPTIYGPM